MTFEGERLFCGVSEIDGTYYISAVPESEMTASRNLTVGVVLFIFFSVAMIVALWRHLRQPRGRKARLAATT